MQEEILYSIRDLTVSYHTRAGDVVAVDDVTMDVMGGEILGLVGESGCGKSTLGKALLRLHTGLAEITSGELVFEGTDLMKLAPREMTNIRGAKLGMIFQDPMTSLNPVQRIVDHIKETILAHEAVSELVAEQRAGEIIELLGIRRERLDDYPHQMSGGMRQRVMISLALALHAELVVADEPTTSLDVIVEAKFLDLLKDLQKKFNLTILMITHNIGVVAEVADRVAVMYAGKIMEIGTVDEVFLKPKHPYTQGLLSSVPNIKLDDKDLYHMEGMPPNLLDPPTGCRFHPRCPYVMDKCRSQVPGLTVIEGRQKAACFLYEEVKAREVVNG